MQRLSLTALLLVGLASPALAQAPPPEPTETQDTAAGGPFPAVTFGVLSFMQFSAELHEQDGYNAFDVTRGYINIEARLSDKVKLRFTPDVRPTTDASLNRNLTLRMEYAALDAQVTENMAVMFGLHQTPWLTFEESVNRYRVLGPFFAERMGLIPGPTDLGASVKYMAGSTEVHAGIYNGEGYGRAELDKYKSIDGRVTVRPFDEDTEAGNVTISGFYQYGWYAEDRPRNVAIVMGSYEKPHFVATAQYLSATDNPFIARDVQRRGLSFFGEGRQGPTGWAAVLGLDLYDLDAENDGESQRRYVFGGAHWSQVGRGRMGLVITMEQVNGVFGGGGSQLQERRLLAQTHVEF
jgi:hypothetical protein